VSAAGGDLFTALTRFPGAGGGLGQLQQLAKGPGLRHGGVELLADRVGVWDLE
jgi:hypothetical protein